MEPGGAALGRCLQRWAAGEGGAMADPGAYPSAAAGPGAEAAGGALKDPTPEATSRAAAGTPARCRGRRAARTPCGVVGLWGGGVMGWWGMGTGRWHPCQHPPRQGLPLRWLRVKLLRRCF